MEDVGKRVPDAAEQSIVAQGRSKPSDIAWARLR